MNNDDSAFDQQNQAPRVSFPKRQLNLATRYVCWLAPVVYVEACRASVSTEEVMGLHPNALACSRTIPVAPNRSAVVVVANALQANLAGHSLGAFADLAHQGMSSSRSSNLPAGLAALSFGLKFDTAAYHLPPLD